MNFESLRNKFEKLRAEWTEDSHVDFQFKNKQYSADLAQVALDIPFCHNKYLISIVIINRTQTHKAVSSVQTVRRENTAQCLDTERVKEQNMVSPSTAKSL